MRNRVWIMVASLVLVPRLAIANEYSCDFDPGHCFQSYDGCPVTPYGGSIDSALSGGSFEPGIRGGAAILVCPPRSRLTITENAYWSSEGEIRLYGTILFENDADLSIHGSFDGHVLLAGDILVPRGSSSAISVITEYPDITVTGRIRSGTQSAYLQSEHGEIFVAGGTRHRKLSLRASEVVLGADVRVSGGFGVYGDTVSMMSPRFRGGPVSISGSRVGIGGRTRISTRDRVFLYGVEMGSARIRAGSIELRGQVGIGAMYVNSRIIQRGGGALRLDGFITRLTNVEVDADRLEIGRHHLLVRLDGTEIISDTMDVADSTCDVEDGDAPSVPCTEYFLP